MSSKTAAKRLAHVREVLDQATPTQEPSSSFKNPHRLQFQAGLPEGVPANYSPLNPVNYLLRSAFIHPDRVAMKHPALGLQWTYKEWAIKVCAVAYGLKKRGVKRGDKIGVICPNVPMILDLWQALPAIHAVMVPLNIRQTRAEVAYILEHSNCTKVVVDKEFEQLTEGFKGEVIVSHDKHGGDLSDPYEQLIKDGKPDADRYGWQGLTLIDDENADFAICYTSGTTGKPKGVVTTYRGTYLAGLANAYHAKMDVNSTYLWTLPAFHAAGWCYPFAITCASSGQVCLRSVGDYSPIWESFKRDNITQYCAAPTVQIAIVNHPMACKLPQDIRTMVAGAAPSAHLINALEKLHIFVVHVYGSTEVYGPTTFCIQQPDWKDTLSEEEFYKRKAMQGHSYVVSDEIRVIRPESSAADGYEDVAADGKEVGEIVFRGNLVMKEYYNDPEANRKVFEGGWLHSGDLAVRMPYGMVSIQDRSKDIIISGGENASSLAIESAIYQHPDVLETCVIARPHEKYGERAHAYVILRDAKKWHGKHGEFEKSLKEHTRPLLPGFARPEWVEVTESLPKSSTGKVLKVELRKRFKSIIPGQ